MLNFVDNPKCGSFLNPIAIKTRGTTAHFLKDFYFPFEDIYPEFIFCKPKNDTLWEIWPKTDRSNSFIFQSSNPPSHPLGKIYSSSASKHNNYQSSKAALVRLSRTFSLNIMNSAALALIFGNKQRVRDAKDTCSVDSLQKFKQIWARCPSSCDCSLIPPTYPHLFHTFIVFMNMCMLIQSISIKVN